jgi:class 3 adenylate cyclase
MIRSMFRFRQERRFPEPPEALWPFVSDTARINELVGQPPYQIEEKLDAQGRVRRFAALKLGPLRIRWEEGFGEWEENRYLVERRQFLSGPMRSFEARCDLFPEGSGSRLVFVGEVECVGLVGFAAKHLGLFQREAVKRLRAIEHLIAEAERTGELAGASARDLIEAPSWRRFAALAQELAADPASHGLAPRLVDLLTHAPSVALRRLRPLALARFWNAQEDAAIELFLAAQKRGLLAMGWDLLCPRCRGAKARVANLHELPKGAHCSSCNIDYGRDFTRNVELTFHPAPWVRALPPGELCSLGPSTTPHVKVQAEIAAHSSAAVPISLAPGPYRFRTVEAGPFADAEVAADERVPEVEARDSSILLGGPGRPGELFLRNDTDRPLIFVVEDRRWAKDALTGERVIASPAFRRLCPEQLLRPGDDAEIAKVAIMFTDLQGSTKLYEELGDARAYRLVRDHFAFLSEAVQRNNGFVVKTVGDAVMAAFHDPADAVRAALAIQDGVAAFNAGREDAAIVLKLGIHAGPCIAVTTVDVLDYFGSTVNAASRLEHQCRGGEVLVSAAVVAEAGAAEVIAERPSAEGEITLRGFSEPIRFRRVGARI